MTKTIFFDTGPIISLVMSRMWWILPKLKEQFGGNFYITPAVYRELIERPLTTKRFKFEALQSLKLVRDGVLEVYNKLPKKKIDELTKLANSSFSIKNKTMDIMQEGETESIACAIETKADAIVIDERTLRLFIENNKEMEKLLEHRFKKDVVANPKTMNQFSQQLQTVPIIRSIELVAVAYKLGWLDGYIPKEKGGREVLLDSVLWATKINGSSVTEHEIEEMKLFLLKK